MVKLTVKWLAGGGALGLLVVLGAYVGWRYGDDARPERLDRQDSRTREHLAITGTPIFFFGDLYLDGRSHWLSRQFERSRQVFRQFSGSRGTKVTARIHPEPYTSGVWVERLDEESAQERVAAETRSVESEVTFQVEGVEPRKLLFFLACANFVDKVDHDVSRKRRHFFPPLEEAPEDVGWLPRLESRQCLTRDTWAGSLLARPTDVYFINKVARDDDVYTLTYQVWRDCGGENHARIRLSSGQYTLKAIAGATLVHLRSFFRGQDIPPGFDALVERMTGDFYEKLSATIRKLAPAWAPTGEARRWIRELAELGSSAAARSGPNSVADR